MNELWNKLKGHAERLQGVTLRELCADESRFGQCSLEFDRMLLDYSKEKIDDQAMHELQGLVAACQVEEKREKLFSGEMVNLTEQRPVLHMALRGGTRNDLSINGCSVAGQVDSVLTSFLDFAESVRTARYLSLTGKAFTDVVNIGIGGSDLGPVMVTQALASWHDGPRLHFVSNIDGDQVYNTLASLNCETTLIIVSSKTLTTRETVYNFETALEWLKQGLGEGYGHHLAAVSTNLKATREYQIDDSRVFPFWEWVGGRYSVWSAIGLPVAIAVGAKAFRNFLNGARTMDEHFVQTPVAQNLPIIYALLGIWRRNLMGWPGVAVIPYSHCLGRLPAYLQQLDMESNGKSVTTAGESVSQSTGPLIWGEPGTNSQHSFFQWLHQGTDVIPVDFIFAANPGPFNGSSRYLSHHDQLITNAVAQANALAFGLDRQQVISAMRAAGYDNSEIERLAPHRVFDGDRPSTTILLDRLTPYQLGKLIALYEHKVFVQGAVWGLNSYDQWGVELGKKLADELAPAITEGQISAQVDSSTRKLLSTLHRFRESDPDVG